MVWKDIRNNVLMEYLKLDENTLDRESGSCIIDIIKGEYQGYSVEGLMVFGMEENVLTVQENAIVYIPVELLPAIEDSVTNNSFTTKRKIVKY